MFAVWFFWLELPFAAAYPLYLALAVVTVTVAWFLLVTIFVGATDDTQRKSM